MNLSGIETFGDALGPNSIGSNDSFSVLETFQFGSGMFVNSTVIGNQFTGGLRSLNGGPSIAVPQSHSEGFTSGTTYTLALTSVPNAVTNDVIAYLGRLGAGSNPGSFDVSTTSGLVEYADSLGIDPSQLTLNTDSSYVTFYYPGAEYSHADFQDGLITYDYIAEYNIPQQPGGGGFYGLGRQKIAENMTPLPTDRFIFDYSYFHNVPIGYRKMPVNRFTPGFEKTFLNKKCSLECRLPFATTLDNTLYTDNNNSTGQLRLGDMTMILKCVLLQREKFAVTAGLGISVPFAEDTHLYNAYTGEEVIRWKNQTVHLMPYVGLLYMPTDRTFFQAYFQVDGATHGDSIHVTNLSETDPGLLYVGKAYDRTYAYTSMAMGYWLFRKHDKYDRLRHGMNLIGELHWTQSLDRAKGVDYTQGNYQFNIGQAKGNYSVLNMTLGTRFLYKEKTSIGLGYSVPLSNGDQKQFDGELRFSLNRYF